MSTTHMGHGWSQPATAVKTKMGHVSKKATAAFIQKPQEFVLLNSTNSDIYFEWHAEKIVVPAADRICPKHPKYVAGDQNYADVRHSAMTKDGKYIPGTLVVRDRIRDGEFGARIVEWSAAEAIQTKLGIDTETGEYTGAYALRGLSLLPEDLDDEAVAEIAAEGRLRWEEWEVRTASEIVQEENIRQDSYKKAGKTATPAAPHVEQAAAFLKVVAERRQVSMRELLGIPDQPAIKEALQEVKPSETAQPMNKYEMLAEILNDPALAAMLKAKLGVAEAPAPAPTTSAAPIPNKETKK